MSGITSPGISIKDILNNSQRDNDDLHSGFVHSNLNSEDLQDGDECFYNLCTSKKSCGRKITCGSFKSSINSILCFLLTVNLFCLFTAVIGPVILYKFADDEVNSQVVVDSTSAPAYDLWHTNAYGQGFEDIKITYDIHYFDCQNWEEAQLGAKPVLVEVGPYAYDEYFEKFDIKWSDDGDTVTYYTYRYYIFNKERSGPGLTEDDDIRMPYPTVAGFQYIISSVPVPLEMFVDLAINTVLHKALDNAHNKTQNLYDQINESRMPGIVNVKDTILLDITILNNSINALFDQIFVFANQSDPLQLLLKVLLAGTPDGISLFYRAKPGIAWFGNLADPLLLEVSALVAKAEEQMGEQIFWTASVPANTFNWSSQADVRRRHSPDVFKTGKKNPKQIGQYVSYNGMKSFWNCVAPTDSKIPWNEGEEFPACAYFDQSWTDVEAEKKGYVKPFATDKANRIEGTDGNTYGRPVTAQTIQIFSYDIYRSGYMGYLHDTHDWHGVKLRRYGIRKEDMYNVTLKPSNAAYWAFGWSGVENLTICQNLPVFVSFPHFLYADDRYVTNLVGIRPDPSLHDSYVDIEPQTGMLARAFKRIQVNYQLFDTSLPTTDPSTLDDAADICAQIQNIGVTIQKIASNFSIPTCNATIPVNLITSLAAPSTWTFPEGWAMIPMGWVQESTVMPKSSADDLNELFEVDDAAAAIQFWCVVIACVSAGLILVLLWSSYDFERRQGVDKSMYTRVDASNHNNGVSSAPLLGDQTKY